jgi:hypothetical protein
MQAQPRFAGRMKRETAATSQVIVLTLFTGCQRECSLTVPDVCSKAVLENDHDRPHCDNSVAALESSHVCAVN